MNPTALPSTAASPSWVGRPPGERDPETSGGDPLLGDPNGSYQKPEERRSSRTRSSPPEPRDVFSLRAPSSQRVGPIPNTGPTNIHARTHLSPQLIRTLLIRGGVELNPGPPQHQPVKCFNCNKTIARRLPPPATYPPIACPLCGKPYHLKCTDLRETRHLHPDWRCQH